MLNSVEILFLYFVKPFVFFQFRVFHFDRAEKSSPALAGPVTERPIQVGNMRTHGLGSATTDLLVACTAKNMLRKNIRKKENV